MICSVREASIRSFRESATTRMSLSASAPDSSTTRLMSASMSVRLIASSTVPLLQVLGVGDVGRPCGRGAA